ncbi:MAG: ribonuclease E/G [Caulobacteraceae bacterium]
MSERKLFLDEGIGERRGVVTLGGRPERLLIERRGTSPVQALGARVVGRVTRIERAFGSAFVDLGAGPAAVLALKPDMPRLAQGAAVEVEIRGEARAEKGPTLRFISVAEGPPRLLLSAPTLEDELRHFEKAADIITGQAARNAADVAEAEALETVFPLPGGGTLAVEPTRALTAVDIDLGDRAGVEVKKAARLANLTALQVLARVLRLKELGGLVVIDLVGRGHDGAALTAAARAAFAPDNPGVAVGPISKFGTLELSIPRRRRPVAEWLAGADAEALRLVRELERRATADPGGRIEASASAQLALPMKPLLAELAQRYGARFSVEYA